MTERYVMAGGRRLKIETPGPGQESVWDYPRPPAVQPVSRRIRVVFGGVVVAESTRALRVVETAGAPVYYLPLDDVQMEYLRRTPHSSFCEWKGSATYYTLEIGGHSSPNAAWLYEQPSAGYEAIAGYLAFYAQRVDEAWVGEERAKPQPGQFYGGWVTREIVGPIKGEPGSSGW